MSQNQDPLRRSRLAWYFYDWANSAFGTIIITFVFSVYVTKSVIGEADDGSGYWSLTVALSGFLVAITAPFIGSLADSGDGNAKWLRITTVACAILTCFLIFLPPSAPLWMIIAGLGIVALAHAASELSYVFYNAMLPALAGEKNIGRISGTAWGVGFLGGIASLVLILLLCIGVGGVGPFLPLSEEGGWNVRASVIFVALWYFIFALPLMMYPPRQDVSTPSAGTNFQELKKTVKVILKMPDLLRLLIASALYRDGLATLFAVGGTFAAAAFDMDYTEILIFAIGLNISSGIGAIVLARIDDVIGSKATIVLSLVGLIVSGATILALEDKWLFIAAALVMGLFIGPAQASSRTFVARLAPAEKRAQIFGFYALSGKAVAFLGPLAYGYLTLWSGSARVGLLSVLAFWFFGLVILLTVKRGGKHEPENP